MEYYCILSVLHVILCSIATCRAITGIIKTIGDLTLFHDLIYCTQEIRQRCNFLINFLNVVELILCRMKMMREVFAWATTATSFV